MRGTVCSGQSTSSNSRGMGASHLAFWGCNYREISTEWNRPGELRIFMGWSALTLMGEAGELRHERTPMSMRDRRALIAGSPIDSMKPQASGKSNWCFGARRSFTYTESGIFLFRPLLHAPQNLHHQGRDATA